MFGAFGTTLAASTTPQDLQDHLQELQGHLQDLQDHLLLLSVHRCCLAGSGDNSQLLACQLLAFYPGRTTSPVNKFLISLSLLTPATSPGVQKTKLAAKYSSTLICVVAAGKP